MHLSIVFTLNVLVLAPMALSYNLRSNIYDTSYSPANPLYTGPASYPTGYNSFYKAPVYTAPAIQHYSGYETGYTDYNNKPAYYVAIAKAGNTPTPSYVQPSIYSAASYPNNNYGNGNSNYHRQPYIHATKDEKPYKEEVTEAAEEDDSDDSKEYQNNCYDSYGKRGKCCKRCRHRHRCNSRRCHDRNNKHDD